MMHNKDFGLQTDYPMNFQILLHSSPYQFLISLTDMLKQK